MKKNNNNTATPAEKGGLNFERLRDLPILRNNFIIMGIAGVMIVLGFLLMVGGGAKDNGFNPDIFSTTRIVIGPLIAFLGFVLMGIGIIVRPSDGKKEEKNAQPDQQA